MVVEKGVAGQRCHSDIWTRMGREGLLLYIDYTRSFFLNCILFSSISFCSQLRSFVKWVLQVFLVDITIIIKIFFFFFVVEIKRFSSFIMESVCGSHTPPMCHRGDDGRGRGFKSKTEIVKEWTVWNSIWHWTPGRSKKTSLLPPSTPIWNF